MMDTTVAQGMFFPKLGFPVLTVILLGVVVMFVVSALLMWLWNITITRIFGIREITFWEAFRLIIIAGILFGGAFKVNL